MSGSEAQQWPGGDWSRRGLLKSAAAAGLAGLPALTGCGVGENCGFGTVSPAPMVERCWG